MMKRLAIISTHPIQYYAPVFKLLSEKIELKVFYTWGEKGLGPKYDPGFGKVVAWDLPLLAGYEYEFLENSAKDPGSHHFNGIDNPHIVEAIKGFGPDAILVYGWSYAAHFKVLKYFRGKIPLWFRGDSNLIDKKKSWKQLFRKVFLKWLYTKVDRAFYVGSANKEYYREYGLKDEQLIFAPHAIDNGRFEEDRLAEACNLREKLGITREEVLILFAGKLETKKNPELLLKAYLQLNLADVHLLFVGNGKLEEKLRKQVKDSENTHVHFMDFQNQQMMPVVYQACDLFCLPSKGPGETWGLAVNEAMAAGKAVIVSDKVGCAQDLVVNTENGYIFESENEQHLCTCISKACSTLDTLVKLGKNSKKIIQNWSFLRQVEALEKELKA